MGSVGKIINGEFQEFANDDDVLVISKEAIENTPITFEQATTLANVESEDSISVALGKLSKLYESLEQDKSNIQELIDSKEIFRGYKLLSAEGWYRVFRFGASNSQSVQGVYGDTILLQLSKDYTANGSEAVQMMITIGFPNKVDFSILSIVKNTDVLKNVRVVYDTVDKCNYLEIYYGTETENGVSYKISFNSTKAINEEIKAIDFEAEKPEQEVVISTIKLIEANSRNSDVRNGIRKIVTGNISLSDYITADNIGSWGHHSGTISDLPTGIDSTGIFDVMFSIGDGDRQYIRQNYIPYTQDVFLTRQMNTDLVPNIRPWSAFYPTGKCFIVDNFSGEFNEANLQAQVHERMKVLANKVSKGNEPVQVTWYGTWPDVTWLSGQLVTSFNMYYTLFYRHDIAYLIYGNIDGDLHSFQNVSQPKYTLNAPYVKVWGIAEWKSAGGNVPSDVYYGSVMRIYGKDEPGVGSLTDSQFLLIAYGDSTWSKIYTGYQSSRGSTTVPWTRIGGGG